MQINLSDLRLLIDGGRRESRLWKYEAANQTPFPVQHVSSSEEFTGSDVSVWLFPLG